MRCCVYKSCAVGRLVVRRVVRRVVVRTVMRSVVLRRRVVLGLLVVVLLVRSGQRGERLHWRIAVNQNGTAYATWYADSSTGCYTFENTVL